MTCKPTCRTPTPTQAHCPTCHNTFGGVTGFDAHRRNGVCAIPPTYREIDGLWRLPMTPERRSLLYPRETDHA